MRVLTTFCRNCGQRITQFHLPIAGTVWRHDGNWSSPCKPKPEWFWKAWIGRSDDGPPVMWMRNLFRIGKWTVGLHLIVRPDHLDCFHTHPARAFRLILWGGYREQLQDDRYDVYRRWLPGRFGWVQPELSHRIHHVYGKRSLSLWIRGPVTHKVELRGTGWNR